VSGHALAIDPLGKLLLFGGLTVPPSPPQYSQGTAFRSNNSWSVLWLPPPVGARARHAMAYDPVRKQTVLFGGTNGLLLSDTWEWNGNAWSAKTFTQAPSAREGASLVWDPVRQMMVLLGGSGFIDTWSYDGTWTPMTSRVGQPVGTGTTSWDPATRTIMTLSDQGDSFLAPDRLVAQRFVVSPSAIPGTTPQRGKLVSSIRATVPGQVVTSVWNGTVWTPLGVAGGTIDNISTANIASALANGVRIGPATTATNRFSTDYVELTIRYVVNN
jgi:hypothetical protein